jgi:hypothetical protein
MHSLSINDVIDSQAGVIIYKRTLLANRLWLGTVNGLHIIKRVPPKRPNIIRRLQLCAFERVRRASHEAAALAHASNNTWLSIFNTKMNSSWRYLNLVLFPALFIRHAKALISRIYRFIVRF